MAALLTAEEIAEQLQCSPDWLYERVRAGTFPAVRCGRLVRFDQEDVDRWVQHQKVNVAEARS
jgi:excisionase family DNA binding protein